MHTPIHETDSAPQRPPAPRGLKRSVRCGRCDQPLYYPSISSHRSLILCCGHCGTQTPIPTAVTRILKVACVGFFLLTVALMVVIAMRQP